MKFGKLLLQAADSSLKICKLEDWMQYKDLKKELKKFYLDKNAATKKHAPRDNKELKSSSLGQTFFKHLKEELIRVSKQYSILEKSSLSEYEQLKKTIENFKCIEPSQFNKKNRQDVLLKLIKKSIEIHEKLLLVSNYAVMNYCGFTKILKKHDKLSGFCTRDKYMTNIVSQSPFARHIWLDTAIEHVEKEFKYLHGIAKELQSSTPEEESKASEINTKDAKPSELCLVGSQSRTVEQHKEGLELLASLAQRACDVKTSDAVSETSQDPDTDDHNNSSSYVETPSKRPRLE